MKDGTVLIGQLPGERPEGVSVGFALLVNGFKESGLRAFVIDLNRGGFASVAGAFSFRRLVTAVHSAFEYLVVLPRASNVYLTLGCSTFGFLRDAVFIWLAYLCRRRTTVHLKGGGYGEFYARCGVLLKRLVRITLSRPDSIVVLGETLREQFSFVKDKRRIKVVYNGLPTAEPRIEDHLRDKPSSPLRVLYMSNMIKSKGVLDVVAACRLLIERGVEVRLRLCGGFISTALEQTEDSLRSAEGLVAELHREKLSDVATYVGVVSGQAKTDELQNADVFVLPTYYEWEGQPISIIEALAFGLPVITTKHKGIPEQIADGVNGLFVSPRAPHEIANALESLARDAALYRCLSQGALQTYRSKFTQRQHLRSLISVITGRDSFPSELVP